MKISRETVEEYATQKGMEPYQIDGIPDGFSFIKRSDLTIAGKKQPGYLQIFIPKVEWTDAHAFCKTELLVTTPEEAKAIDLDLDVYLRAKESQLLGVYNQEIKKRDGTK